MVSYFSAEVTRGIWKPAFMNGTDWPSPAANLSIVEQQIKKILAATGVDMPRLAVGMCLYLLIVKTKNNKQENKNKNELCGSTFTTFLTSRVTIKFDK